MKDVQSLGEAAERHSVDVTFEYKISEADLEIARRTPIEYIDRRPSWLVTDQFVADRTFILDDPSETWRSNSVHGG